MKDGLFSPSFRAARARPMAATFATNSPNCFNSRAAGRQAEKLVTLTAAGNPVAVNLFTVTSFIELKRIFGIFEDVTNVVDIEEVRLDTYDGTVSALLTLADNLVCDGATIGSAMVKTDDAAAILEYLKSDQVRVYEADKNSIVTPVTINAKNGATTYIRMLYKNADTNLNCQIRWYAEWRSLCGSPGFVIPV